MNKLLMTALLFSILPLSVRAQDKVSVEQPVATATKPVDVNAATIISSKASSKAKSAVRADRLDLETTVVTGNRELPKVLYIVPWKRADLGELPAQPFNTLLDEVLQPVDRDVFKREVKYFQAVAAGAGTSAKSSAAPSSASPP